MLLDARRRGVSFERTMTLAHQALCLRPEEVRRLRSYPCADAPAPTKPPLEDYQWGVYSDSFFRDLLGVRTLDVLDKSAYEGATVLHDLNDPVPSSLWGKYDAVVDGGSLEHVFNFPVAMANVMRMARVGGSVFLSLPANNLCGHGFYQFSPELMFRVFSEDNGFRLLRVILFKARFPGVELSQSNGTYRVVDPAEVHTRVGLISSVPVMMMVEAVKTEERPPFAAVPQQSDYVALWESHPRASESNRARVALKRIASGLPGALQRRLLGYYTKWAFSFWNRRFYQKLPKHR